MDGRDIALLGGLMGADDDEMEDLYLMGVTPPPGRRPSTSHRASSRVQARNRVASAVAPGGMGLPEIGARYIDCPFPAHQFTNGSALLVNVVATPQKPFKGVRWVIAEARSAATVVGLLTVANVFVGVQPQAVAIGNIPAAAYAANAFQVDRALTPCPPGVNITIQIALSITPPAGETLDVAITLIGLAVAE